MVQEEKSSSAEDQLMLFHKSIIVSALFAVLCLFCLWEVQAALVILLVAFRKPFNGTAWYYLLPLIAYSFKRL